MVRTIGLPFWPRATALLFLFCAVWSPAAEAQPTAGSRSSGWEINLHAAALRPELFDEGGEALQFGARIYGHFANGLSLGGSVDWASTDDVTLTPFAGLSANLLLYSAGLDYRFRVSPRTDLFLGAGVGAATLAFDDVPIGVAESSTGLMFPVGGGIRIYDRAVAPNWAFRFDVRDNVILLETVTSNGDGETEPRNNYEVSAGFSFLFGLGGLETIAEVDTDGDGVPDARDFCLNRPGVTVDARGCPLQPAPAAERRAPPDVPDEAEEAEEPAAVADPARPGDEDGDGVPDDVDACPGTPDGISVDERGCLARPAPEPADDAEAGAVPPRPVPVVPLPEEGEARGCLDDRDWFAAEESVEFDGRRFEPVGLPKPVDPLFLVRVGTYDGVPIYVSDAAQAPYPDFWMPACGPGNLFMLYVEVGSLP